jgi:hypothetical protein
VAAPAVAEHEGRLSLVKSGTGYLLGKDGNPVLLRVNDPNDPSGIADRIPK